VQDLAAKTFPVHCGILYPQWALNTLLLPCRYVYSDLSMIVLMYVVGSIAFSNDLVVQSDFSPECQEALLVSNGPKGLLLQCAYEVSSDAFQFISGPCFKSPTYSHLMSLQYDKPV
jgi:hypothetical protein